MQLDQRARADHTTPTPTPTPAPAPALARTPAGTATGATARRRLGRLTATTAAVATASALSLGMAPTATATAAAPSGSTSAAAESAAILPLLQLIPLELPLLSGLADIGDVGSTLSVAQPVWNLLGVSNSIVWLRDGVPIPGTEGLWSYVPVGEDAGHQLAAQVTGTLLGLLPVTLITDALGITLPGGGEPGGPGDPLATVPKALTAVGISGTGKVGSVMMAKLPLWDQTGVLTKFQWLRDGAAIPGAIQQTYVVGAADVAKSITVRATGSLDDLLGLTTSTAVRGVLGDAITPVTQPTISGTPSPGRVLTVTPGTWSGVGELTQTFQWYRGRTPIGGATGSTYSVQQADAGSTLAVIVSATRTGFAPGTGYGLASVAKAPSSTRLVLGSPTVKQGTPATVRIQLSGATTPSGAVTLRDGSRTLRTVTVRPADNGSLLVELPRLTPGRHALSAVFAGDAVNQASTSPAVTLTVTKKKVKKGKPGKR